MIFDIVLILMLIISFNRASKKGSTEDMHFVIGFFIVVRMAGAFYPLLAGILKNFVKNESFAMYLSYGIVALITFFIFTSAAGQRIIELGKKLPKKTGLVITYIFAFLKTVIIYSVIFSFIYTLPVLKRFPDKLITPKSYKLTYGILGTGTENVFQNLSDYLTETLNNPVKFLESQKKKQATGSHKTLDAVKSHEGLEDFVKEKPAEKKETEEEKP